MSGAADESGPASWASTTTLGEIAAWLVARRRVVLTTHVKPDGDAVGSTLGVTRALHAAGIDAIPWYFGPLPDWLGAVAGATKYRVVDQNGLPPEEPDGVLVLDTGTWTQLHDVESWLRERHAIAAVVDHHTHGDPDVAPRRWVEPGCAAVSQPAAELCRLLLGASRLDDLPAPVAEPLYLGIATDTGWFRHANLSPRALREAASLLAAGADHPALFEAVEQQNRPSRLALMARALASLELVRGGRVGIMTLRQQDFHDTRAAPTDTAGFVDLPLSVAGVMLSVVITEAFAGPHGTNITKLSLRSKEGPGAVDANALARRLGGGGHVRAAGVKMPVTLDEARRRLDAVLP